MRKATQSKTKHPKICPHCGSVIPAKRVIRANEEQAHLSPRQNKVLRLIAGGMTCSQIGEELGISRRTADFHRMMVLKTLGLESR